MVVVLYLNQLKKQINGGFSGTVAAIGIPMAIDLASKLFGSGLQLGKKPPGGYGKGMHVGPKPGNLYPYYPPPFLGSWGGEEKGLLLGKKQSIEQYSNSKGYSVNKPPFKDIPLSNFDLLEWVKYLKIPNFKGIYSSNSNNHIHKTGCCIINLDDKIGNGTHWVATFIKNKNLVLYFDSFCLPPPQEFLVYANKLNMKYKYY